MQEIINQIQFKIDELLDQVTKLEIAKEVLQKVGPQSTEAPPAAKVAAAVEGGQPAAAIRAVRPKKNVNRKAVRTGITNMLKTQDHVGTREIILTMFGAKPSLAEQKSVWNTLTYLTKRGELVRTGTGIYSKPSLISEQTRRLMEHI